MEGFDEVVGFGFVRSIGLFRAIAGGLEPNLTIFLTSWLPSGPEGDPEGPVCVWHTWIRSTPRCPHTPGHPGSLGKVDQGLPTSNLRLLLLSMAYQAWNGDFVAGNGHPDLGGGF